MRKTTFNLRTVLTYSLLSTMLFSCTTDEVLNDDFLESESRSSLSSKSVEIPISSISASTQHNRYPVSNAIDNKTNTRWAGKGTSANLYIDLGAEQAVDYVKIAFWKGDSRQSYFTYWVSDNGSNWTYVQKKTSSGNTADFETFDLNNKTTRYVRLKCQGSSVENWNNISELELYGTLLNNASTSPSSSPMSSGSGAFNLDDFQIETSWDSSGDNYKKTASYDAESTDNKDWYDKIGSTYVLRCEAKDGNRTEWKERSGKESSLSTNKVMEYTTKITNEPENGVTIAQIHNRGGVKRPYVRVYLEHGEILIKETTSDPSKNSASYNTYDENLEYNEGTDLTVKIETKSGKAYITITTTKGSYSKTLTPSSNWDDFKSDFYLKAGVYTEGDDIEPISTFSKFSFERN